MAELQYTGQNQKKLLVHRSWEYASKLSGALSLFYAAELSCAELFQKKMWGVRV